MLDRERVDYIQWLFPTKQASQFNPNAPLLNDQDIAEFAKDKKLRDKLLASFDLMLNFYGFGRDGLSIFHSDDWDTKSTNWIKPGNHNFLRITRILMSLSLLGLKEYDPSRNSILIDSSKGTSIKLED